MKGATVVSETFKDLPYYRDGQWVRAPWPLQEDWTTNLDAALRAGGFVPFLVVGEDVRTGIEIKTWRRESTAPHFFIIVGDTESWAAVVAHELNDLMDLLARWAPVVSHSALACVLEDPEYYLEKVISRIETGSWPKPPRYHKST